MNPAASSPVDLEMARSILAVDCAESTSRSVFAELREAYEDSNLLLNVDVVDLRDASAEIRAAVQREGIPWID